MEGMKLNVCGVIWCALHFVPSNCSSVKQYVFNLIVAKTCVLHIESVFIHILFLCCERFMYVI